MRSGSAAYIGGLGVPRTGRRLQTAQGVMQMAWVRDEDGTLREYPTSKAGLARFLKAGTRLTMSRPAKHVSREPRAVVRANARGFTTAEDGRHSFQGYEVTFGPYGFEMYHRAANARDDVCLLFRYAEVDERMARLDQDATASESIK